MNRSKIVATLFLGFILPLGLYAGDNFIGEVVYIEGAPVVYRGGQAEGMPLDFGFQLKNLDVISTDDDSMVEISVFSEGGMEGAIVVNAGTEFYLAFDESEQESAVQLLRGSANFSVHKLPANHQFKVVTAQAAMGVRGTEFLVDTTAQGDFLVAVDSGRVEVDNQDEVVMAVPGKAAEYTEEAGLRSFDLAPGQAGEYRSTWRQHRLKAMRANPWAALRHLTGRYRAAKIRFVELNRDLMEHQDIIDQWIIEDRQGRRAGRATYMRQKAAIAGPLMRIAAHMVIFERLYYRVLEISGLIMEAMDENSEGYAEISSFNREFQEDAEYLRQRMHMLRYIMRLFAERNDGRLPFRANPPTRD